MGTGQLNKADARYLKMKNKQERFTTNDIQVEIYLNLE